MQGKWISLSCPVRVLGAQSIILRQASRFNIHFVRKRQVWVVALYRVYLGNINFIPVLPMSDMNRCVSGLDCCNCLSEKDRNTPPSCEAWITKPIFGFLPCARRVIALQGPAETLQNQWYQWSSLFMFEDIPFNTLYSPHQNENFAVAYRLMIEMLDDPQIFYNRVLEAKSTVSQYFFYLVETTILNWTELGESSLWSLTRYIHFGSPS